MAFKRGNIPWNRGRSHSQETIKKLRVSKKNISLETRKKMSIGQKNRVHKDYKGKVLKICEICDKKFKVFKYLGSKQRFCSIICKALWQRNRQRGSLSHFWKGGKTKLHRLIRTKAEYRLWRKAVFERDKYTCVWCGAKSRKGNAVELQADHIKPFFLYPELWFAIDNGRTLCRDCHKKTDTWAGKAKKHARSQ